MCGFGVVSALSRRSQRLSYASLRFPSRNPPHSSVQLERAVFEPNAHARWAQTTPKSPKPWPFVSVIDTKDLKLLEALLAGASIEDAASTAGMSARTARRHVAKQAFKDQLTESRQAVVQSVVARLTAGAESVCGVLLNLIEDTETPPSVRARAGKDWLESLQSFGATEDLAARLATLEENVTRVLEGRRAA